MKKCGIKRYNRQASLQMTVIPVANVENICDQHLRSQTFMGMGKPDVCRIDALALPSYRSPYGQELFFFFFFFFLYSILFIHLLEHKCLQLPIAYSQLSWDWVPVCWYYSQVIRNKSYTLVLSLRGVPRASCEFHLCSYR